MSDVSEVRPERQNVQNGIGQGQDGNFSDLVQQKQRAVSSADPVAQVPVEYRKGTAMPFKMNETK